MWSQVAKTGEPERDAVSRPSREKLLIARSRMQEALVLLDENSRSAAGASLDMAIQRLNRELS